MTLKELAEAGGFDRNRWGCSFKKCKEKGNWIRVHVKQNKKSRTMDFEHPRNIHSLDGSSWLIELKDSHQE